MKSPATYWWRGIPSTVPCKGLRGEHAENILAGTFCLIQVDILHITHVTDTAV